MTLGTRRWNKARQEATVAGPQSHRTVLTRGLEDKTDAFKE